MAVTKNYQLPIIDGTMTGNVPRDVNALANAVDAAIKIGSNKLIISTTAPSSPTSSTWWYQDLGDSIDFSSGESESGDIDGGKFEDTEEEAFIEGGEF